MNTSADSQPRSARQSQRESTPMSTRKVRRMQVTRGVSDDKSSDNDSSQLGWFEDVGAMVLHVKPHQCTDTIDVCSATVQDLWQEPREGSRFLTMVEDPFSYFTAGTLFFLV